MKIFVINLKKDVEKREKVELELKNNDLFDYEIIEAINGNELSEDEFEKLVFDYKNCYLTKGEIGCVLSHQLAYKKMIEQDLHCCLILEDDVIINKQAKEFLYEMDKFLKDKKDNITLLYRARKFYKNSLILLKNRFKIYLSANPFWAHAYVITQDSAKTLLKINSPIILEADEWLLFKELSFLKTYSCDEDLIVSYDNVEKSYSNLEFERSLNYEKRKIYRKNMIRKQKGYRFYKLYFKLFKRPFLKVGINEEV